MTVTDLPPSRRYSVRLTDPDGKSSRLGRMRAEITQDPLRLLNRTGQEYRSWGLVSVGGSTKAWELTTDDGSVLTLSSCGCGS